MNRYLEDKMLDKIKRKINEPGSGSTMSPSALLMAFLLLTGSAWAAEGTGFDAETYINTGFLIFLIFVIVMTIVFLIGHNKTAEQEKEMVKKIDHMINDAKPVEEEHELLLEHNYDGIRELDNNLPPWWKYMFYLTIFFSIVYMGYYHVLNGPSSAKEYENEVREAQLALAATQGNQPVSAENVKLLTDAASLAKGKEIFIKNCASCHGNKGEGMVGPNLTDDYWIHGGGVKDVYLVLVNGVLAKGMPSWKAQFSPQDLEAVASFVKSLHGTNPPNAKEKQGDLFKEEAAADTSKKAATPKDSVKAKK